MERPIFSSRPIPTAVNSANDSEDVGSLVHAKKASNKVNDDNNLQTKKKCVPFISQYTDCNDDNKCTGCSRCNCNAEGEWSCQEEKQCLDVPSADDSRGDDDDEIFDNALNTLEYEMNKKRLHNIQLSSDQYMPAPHVLDDHNDVLVSQNQRIDQFLASLQRSKRSTAEITRKSSKRSTDMQHANTTNSSRNNTVKFHDVIDEINEDSLKDSKLSGTLVAKKIDMIPTLSGLRRSNFADNSSKTLQIEYNQPKVYNHITDNKIETLEQENFDSSHQNLKTVLGNYTQKMKNKDLSKIVVNELKKGREIIGDVSSPVISNITFTPENDTLTAMAFIAGNLLNKLWNMEKDPSVSSVETDELKQEKISDLLDLFKEPLNLRQVTFLKNALEQLSSAIEKDKDVKNISICDVIHETEKLLYNTSSTSDEETSKVPCGHNKTQGDMENEVKKAKKDIGINQKKATIKAIAKINNVIDLIKKIEKVQGNLSEMKLEPKLVFNHTFSKKHDFDTELTKDEKNSLNLFGNLLEKITKLILPKRNNKKIKNSIKSQNFLTGNENLKKKLKKIYNIDLTNMTMTAKDKIILDYLSHVDRNPDCLLNNKNSKIEAMPSFEGNILLNLSEFLKLKSLSDLIKLLESEKSLDRTETLTVETTTKEIENKTLSRNKDDDSNKFNSTKEKLKAHLKTIIEDLIEIQSARGINLKGDIRISDALPCIYNILKAGREEIVTKEEEKIDPVKKIVNIFQGLKKELKTRRSSDLIMEKRPKSAVVWERLVKNLNDQSRSKSRRSSNNRIPKSYDKIKEMMERIENGSSTYKRYALLVKVPASGKLILLKALEQDVQATINILNDITLSFENLMKLPKEKFAELEEFIGNMATSIKLSEKVNEKVKLEPKKLFVPELNSINKILKTKLKNPIFSNSDFQSEKSDDMKISRTQIVNQLIRNRMEMYLKLKDNSGIDVNQDLRYGIARRILHYLDTGNNKLANELFRIFVTYKQEKLGVVSKNEPAKDNYVVTSTPKHKETSIRRMAQHQKDLSAQLENSNSMKAKHLNWVTQDNLLKQLLNIKNMRM